MKTNQTDPVAPAMSFRHFLQGELARRCARNRSYSLRAFAKFLECDHSTLSQLLRGKRRLTSRTIRRCGIRLGLDEASVEEFIRAEAPDAGVEETVLLNVRQLVGDAANLVTEWQHFAILELTRVSDFRPDTRWIARVLGLTPDEVNVCLQRLLRLGLLAMDGPDRWSDRTGNASVSLRGFTVAALSGLLRQSRDLLIASLARGESERGAYSSTTIALPAGRVPELVERIARFRHELGSLATPAATADEVYRLEISLIPLTRWNTLEESDGTARDGLADRDPPT